MIQTIIVEDEPISQELLKLNIKEFFPECEIVAIVDNVTDAISAINNLKPDLVFMDIQIKGGTGFDVLEQLKESELKVVFVTAFSNYAIQAIKAKALDYVLKPINKLEFLATVNHVRTYFSKTTKETSFITQSIPIKTNLGTEYIKFDNIIFLKADGAYTKVQLINSSILSAKNIGEFENFLPPSLFYRCHHSYIINTQHIEKLRKGRNGMIHLTQNNSIPISQRKMKGFVELLKTLKSQF
jgi:two-component system, LytTR family, response regulator